MGYENQPRSSLAPLVVVFLVLGSMMFAGLVVTAVFGGWFFLRKSSIRPMEFERHQAVQVEKTVRAAAEEAAEAARAQAEQAREMAAQLKKQVADENVPVRQITIEVTDENVPVRQITIEMDQDGVMKLNGDAIALPALLNRLKALAADKAASITIDVRADEECPFQHVADLIAACQKLGITRFRFGTLEAAIAEEPAEDQEPASVIK